MTRGFGTIKKLKDGTWQARIYVGPGKKRKAKNCPTKGLADAWLKAKQAEKIGIAVGTLPGGTHEGITYAEAMPEALDHYNARRVYTDRTAYQRQQIAKAVLERWGKRKISAIRPKDHDDYVLELRAADLSTSSIRHRLGMLSQVERYAFRQGYISKLPPPIERPKLVQKTTVEDYTDDQVERLVAAARIDFDKRALAAVLFFRHTGARISELGIVRCGDFLLDDDPRVDFHVRGERSDRPKNARSRTVPIEHAETVEVLRTLRGSRAAAEPMFGALRSRDAIVGLLRPTWMAALGGEPTPHRLRHTYGTREGMRLPVPELARRMGHEDWKTTQRYVHVREKAAADGHPVAISKNRPVVLRQRKRAVSK